MINFCTLFDFNYLEKGLALYYSLVDSCPEFMLYIVAFDDKSFIKLKELNLDRTIIISYSEFEDERLRIAKSNRSLREFLWTCSSFEIKYIISHYNVSNCTYIDSDVFFYSDPSYAINKFLSSDSDAAIISHNYSNHLENRVYKRIYGEYCVEFNTFKNTNRGLEILNWWCDKCFELCPEKPQKDAFGDQKYLDYISNEFDGVYVYDDFGLGLAPWNIDEYELLDDKSLKNKITRTTGNIIFYHFHSILMYENVADINIYKRPGTFDDCLVNLLYIDYLNLLKDIRKKYKDNPTTYSGNRPNIFIRTLSYMFEEHSLLIAIRKLYRLLRYRKKDLFNF